MFFPTRGVLLGLRALQYQNIRITEHRHLFGQVDTEVICYLSDFYGAL